MSTSSSATTVKLDADTKERIQRLASEKQRSAHWVLREAVQQYVEREESRFQLRRDATAAWENFKASGLHVTEGEADAWLARLEAGEDAEPPACHD